MTSNPFIRLYEAPVESLTLAAYLLLFAVVLLLTWWALIRNALEITKAVQEETWVKNAPLYPPFGFMLRLVAIPGIIAIDLFLVAAFLHFLI
ncbi:uncharacterized protein Nmag_1652 [Natrialba magadii ATCC 43099]|uniref:Uncharacterized protein n=1 Tax=Natrialba magadii (strain ATCC 43099 / DSM 3394 / CCM 3739 / CIP 104546 / IAM 13178 / JCM 8861 / NBRC 102185 / NCIMB 2190 / MS3) TaxID=547559 RepID=D3SUH0_NATMM|nr:hypothetical protein [Natrialba magadii]ADD05228.1 uncharacterized protein Nmag_1652 [Natrialba magadii ATCC 43099]ELY23074.1 hypothetical protein C500_20783 [Natrialba magadii ATCC 43099]